MPTLAYLPNLASSRPLVPRVLLRWGELTAMCLRLSSCRLGLERSATAKEALDVIVALLEEHGQGGNYYEDAGSCHSFQSAYLIVDCEEAWVLETVGKYWAAEKITGECRWQGTISRTGGRRPCFLDLQNSGCSCKASLGFIFKLVPLLSGLLLLERNVQCPEPAAKPVIAGKVHS